MDKKKPSFDDMMEAPLEKLSAADLLEVMMERADVARAVSLLPEKKKAELEVEPVIPRLRLKDFVKQLRGEKKKVEYELGPVPEPSRPRASLPPGRLQEWKKAAYEVDDYYGVHVITPAVMDALVSQLEERLVARLKSLGVRG